MGVSTRPDYPSKRSTPSTPNEANVLKPDPSQPAFDLPPLAPAGRSPSRYIDPMPLVEKRLIERIRRRAHGSHSYGSRSVVAGIGDDCAILRVPPRHELLVTTDFSIEGVHFRRDWHPPELVGRRCLTRGLSDIAAMGGEPRAVFLSLAVAGNVPQPWVDRFLTGLLDLADEFNVRLAGGDTAQSDHGILADIVVVGSVPRGTAVLRSGAQPGDQIYVTGELGAAAAELAQLRKLKPAKLGTAKSKTQSNSNSPDSPPSKYSQHLGPYPRIAVGKILRRRRIASAMIDLSDGLSTDLDHICHESHVNAEIDASAIPRARNLQHVGEKTPATVDFDFALHGGDDYELLFTSSAAVPAHIAGVPVTCIGRILPSSTTPMGMRMIDAAGKSRPLKAAGWEHFKRK
jgi:thiamine-monophosphate kinase